MDVARLKSCYLRVLQLSKAFCFNKTALGRLTSISACIQSVSTLQPPTVSVPVPLVQLQTRNLYAFPNFNRFKMDAKTTVLANNKVFNVNMMSQKRYMGMKKRSNAWRHKNKKPRKPMSDVESEDELDNEYSEDEDSDEEDSDGEFLSGKHYPEDSNLPDNFKDIRIHVPSLRTDSVASKGLNLARNEIEDFLLSSKLQVNGKIASKKSKPVSTGDFIDLVQNVQDGRKNFRRVRVLNVLNSKTSSDKRVVYVRVWKNIVSTPL